jgi:uncharacterized protein (TIGR00266 family)
MPGKTSKSRESGSSKKSLKASKRNSTFKEEAINIITNELSPAEINNTTVNAVNVDSDLDSFSPSISRKFNGDGKMIPKFHIINSPAFASVVISLKQGQSIYCNSGCLNYMDSSVNVSTKTNGILSGLIRSMFTTTSMFLTFYTGTQMKESIVSLSSFMPGDIIALRIKRGEQYVMSSFGFLAATANVKVTTTMRFKNILGGDSIFINQVNLDDTSNEDGIVWISSYGGFDKITIKEGESVKVDQGMFAFAKKEYKYELSTIGNVKSFFLSGETFMMKFKGPCEIYVHSNDFNKFIRYIGERASALRPTNAVNNPAFQNLSHPNHFGIGANINGMNLNAEIPLNNGMDFGAGFGAGFGSGFGIN